MSSRAKLIRPGCTVHSVSPQSAANCQSSERAGELLWPTEIQIQNSTWAQRNSPHVLKSLWRSIQIGSWAPGGPERKCPGHEAAKAPAKLLKTAPYTNCQHDWKVSGGSVTTCIHPSTYLTGKTPWTESVSDLKPGCWSKNHHWTSPGSWWRSSSGSCLSPPTHLFDQETLVWNRTVCCGEVYRMCSSVLF